MVDLAIIVGDSPEAVIATAEKRRIEIDPNDIRAFDSLTTSYVPKFPRGGKIEIDRAGFVVVGVVL